MTGFPSNTAALLAFLGRPTLRFGARRAPRRRLMVSAALVMPMLYAQAAHADPIRQGWPGIVPGSNDYSVTVAYDTPLEACQSMQNSFVPKFGYQVFGLVTDGSRGEDYNPFTGALAPSWLCRYDAGNNGEPSIFLYKGCSEGKLVNGTCIPWEYPVTAEPVCDDGCKGVPGEFPAIGDPVSLSTGAKYESVVDYTSGGPYPIEIKRFYRSMMMPTAGTGLGLAWRTDIAGRKMRTESYDLGSPYNVVVSRENGEESRFLNPSSPNTLGEWNQYSIEIFIGSDGSERVQGVGDAKDRLRRTGFSTFEYVDEKDRVDTFSGGADGVIKSVWRGGYQRDYVYAETDYNRDRPIQITDSLGRVVNITWIGNLISEIQVPDGVRIRYTYEPLLDAGGQPVAGTEVLTQVARYKADGTLIDSTGYQYDRGQTSTIVPFLTGITDAEGVLIDSTTYDSAGRVLTAQGPDGVNAVGLTYDDVQGTRTVTDALNQVTTYTMRPNSSSNIHPILKFRSAVRHASATVPTATKSMSYSFGEYLKTDWNGVVTRLAYDAYQNETSRIEDDNGIKRTTTTTWSPTFHLPTQIVAPNLTINFTYNTAGRLIRREEIDTSNSRKPVSRVWTYTWTALGLLETETGPRTDVVQTTRYTYDAAGNLATTTNALNHVTTVNSVNASGLPTSVTDPNGVITLMTYDPLGRIATVSVQGPVPATTSFGYDVNGLMTSVTSPTGVTLTYGYDDAHRLTSIRDGQGNTTVFALDDHGNKLQTQIQTASTQVLMANSATFDSLGRLLTSIGAANQTTRYEYDHNSNLTKVTNPRNAVTQSAFDALNRVKQVTDALNGVTKLTYDGQDSVTSVTDAKLHATSYTLNGFGFVTQVISPDNGTTAYTYDLAGNVKTRTDARRVVTNYTYDALDRPLTRTYSASTENVTYVYDSVASGNLGRGHLTSVTDAAGTASFTYDAYGNRVSERRTIAGINYVTSYAYDLDGNVSKITYPSGLIVNYQRDNLGGIATVTMQANASASPVTLASSIAYRPFGPMQSATLGNGVQLTNSYDLDYRLTGLQATGGATLQALTLGYDGADNVMSIADGVTPSLSQTFEYDLLDRVKKGTGAYGVDNYTHDAVGNRLTRSLVQGGTTTNTNYTYTSSNNQLATAVTGSTTLKYAYDANGSLLSRKLGNATQAAYTYNNDARLSVSGTASMKYNAFGQRSVETVGTAGAHYLFDQDGLLLAEHNAQGALVRNYIYLNGQPLALIDATGTVSYILNDQIGQPQKMLNGSGAVSWHRVAGIFGDTVSQPVGSTGSNPHRFPGQQHDAATGLHYNLLRDYDPVTGRYIETDPIGLNGGLNPYLYVNGNPVIYIDRFGLCWYYSQSTGKLTHVNAQGKVDYTKTGGYAGAGKGKNNPSMQFVPNTGPIPQGTYEVGKPYNSKKTGPFSIPLKPDPSNNMGGRSAFLMHGDNKTHTASEGCIIFPRDVRDIVDKSKDKCLKVTP